MKKTLFVLSVALLASTSVYAANWDYAQNYSAPSYGTYQQPVTRPVAQKNARVLSSRKKSAGQNKTEAQYRLGNPLYHPTRGQVVAGGEASYEYTPKEEAIGQEKVGGYTLAPGVEMGLTNKLSAYLDAGYGKFRVKSGLSKGLKFANYAIQTGLRYLLASADGFDFNVKAGLYYDKERLQNHFVTARRTGTDIAFQVGKKIRNVTPYFSVGFATDFWSKRYSSSGTDTYINPGVYIDLTKALSLKLDYTSVTHGDARYRATVDVYPTKATVFSLGGFIYHPETDRDTYGATAGMKVAF